MKSVIPCGDTNRWELIESPSYVCKDCHLEVFGYQNFVEHLSTNHWDNTKHLPCNKDYPTCNIVSPTGPLSNAKAKRREHVIGCYNIPRFKCTTCHTVYVR